MTNSNDPRLKQDDYERKDKENSNAGMIGGIIIVLLAILGFYFYYTYEIAPAPLPPTAETATTAENAPGETQPTTEQQAPAHQ